ncbi:MAG: DUF3445 domain-containing protein [Pseudomonadota bacterium]
MSSPVLHDRLSCHPWMVPQRARLPGLWPVDRAEWLIRDECYGAQMALRTTLIRMARSKVFQVASGYEQPAHAASATLLETVITTLNADGSFAVDGAGAAPSSKARFIITPDGRAINPDKDHPLIALGHLVQEDFAILAPDETGHYRLIAGIICFPASWTLAQKIGRGLTALHGPVAAYDDGLAGRMNRIFTALPAHQLLGRANVLIYEDADLHQPRKEGENKPLQPGGARFIRVERQTLYPMRLPSGARVVVFSIHTSVVTAARLAAYDPVAFAKLKSLRPEIV